MARLPRPFQDNWDANFMDRYTRKLEQELEQRVVGDEAGSFGGYEEQEVMYDTLTPGMFPETSISRSLAGPVTLASQRSIILGDAFAIPSNWQNSQPVSLTATARIDGTLRQFNRTRGNNVDNVSEARRLVANYNAGVVNAMTIISASRTEIYNVQGQEQAINVSVQINTRLTPPNNIHLQLSHQGIGYNAIITDVAVRWSAGIVSGNTPINFANLQNIGAIVAGDIEYHFRYRHGGVELIDVLFDGDEFRALNAATADLPVSGLAASQTIQRQFFYSGSHTGTVERFILHIGRTADNEVLVGIQDWDNATLPSPDFILRRAIVA